MRLGLICGAWLVMQCACASASDIYVDNLVGDDAYGGRRGDSWAPLPEGRPFLHAADLEFEHPDTGQRLRFNSPLAPDLGSVLGGIIQAGAGAGLSLDL